MNLYIRYFNDETVVHNMEEAVNFLKSLDLDDFRIDDDFLNDLQNYANSSIPYPRRYKVHAHVYFIVIKTEAETLEEFKLNSKTAVPAQEEYSMAQPNKKFKASVLTEEIPGWYDGILNFKRVIAIPGTNKFQYKDTRFRAWCKAKSPLDCYNRIVDHLRSRQDVDMRSQFPSAKGRNFSFTYLGNVRPKELP